MNTSPGAPGTGSQRPLSPHLQIYRFTPTMAASILHRITGIGLYAGTLVLAWWLAAAAIGPDYFAFVSGLLSTILGRLVLFGFTLALALHLVGGIRHLIWDTGALMDKQVSTRLALASFAIAFLLTLAIWLAAYALRG